MDAFLRVIVIFNEQEYGLIVKNNSTVGDLKRKLHYFIGLEPERQKIANVNFNVLGNKSENECKITDILESGLFNPPISRFVIEEIAGASANAQQVETEQTEQLVEGPPVQNLTYRGFKFMCPPRTNKKLVILDIDETIYDSSLHRTVKEYLAGRPHLQTLLTEVYPYYDIGLWSATPMAEIERKAAVLDINNKIAYTIMFYADIEATVVVQMPGDSPKRTKPLQKIFQHFNHYNSSNTILCDDQSRNFCLNPKNGLLVLEYSWIHRKTDIELVLLKKYLLRIAKVKDVSQISHRNWRRHACFKSKEASSA